MTAPALQSAPDFDNLDMVIGQAHGLAVCLDALAQDFPGLCNPDPMANGINSIIRAVKAEIEKVQAVSDAVRKGLK